MALTGTRKGKARSPRLRDDESGVFMVVEAVLVAVIILTAIVFFTSVQRPVHGGQEGSTNLGQVSADDLRILENRVFTITQNTDCPVAPVPAVSLELRDWVSLVLAGDCNTARAVDEFLADLVPAGARYSIRLNNGFDTMAILPYEGSGLPAGAGAAETPMLPRWTSNSDQTRVLDDAAIAGTTTLTSATANFQAGDVGRTVSGAGIPAGTIIAAVTTPSVALMSKAATTTAADVRVVLDVPAASPGEQVAVGIPHYSFTQAATLCIRAPAPAAAASWRSRHVDDGALTLASTTVTSATALFTAADVGKGIVATGLPPGTTILSITSSSEIVVSNAAPWTATNVHLTILDEGTTTGPGGATWASLWQGQAAGEERVPSAAPYGVWAGYASADCTGAAVYARVGLPAAPAPDNFPMYGVQLVVWYGA